jgi:hypothetical protein
MFQPDRIKIDRPVEPSILDPALMPFYPQGIFAPPMRRMSSRPPIVDKISTKGCFVSRSTFG